MVSNVAEDKANGNFESKCESLLKSERTQRTQPRFQVLSSPKRKTLVGSGQLPPRFRVLANKINVEDVLQIDSCSYLA